MLNIESVSFCSFVKCHVEITRTGKHGPYQVNIDGAWLPNRANDCAYDSAVVTSLSGNLKSRGSLSLKAGIDILRLAIGVSPLRQCI